MYLTINFAKNTYCSVLLLSLEYRSTTSIQASGALAIGRQKQSCHIRTFVVIRYTTHQKNRSTWIVAELIAEWTTVILKSNLMITQK